MNHRPLLLLTALTALTSTPVLLAAQEAPASPITFGIKGGATFGKLSNGDNLPDDLDDRTGFAAGLYGGARFGAFEIGLDAMYVQRGLTSDLATSPLPTRLDYIDIPLYLKLFLPIPAVQPYIYAGPQVSFEIHCETASGGDCPEPSEREETDFLGVGGLGVRLGSFSGIGVGIEGRYLYGFRNLNVTGVSDDDNKTRAFMLLLSVGR